MHPKFRQSLWLTALLVVLVLVFQSVATACPTCKEGLVAGDHDSANLVRGYFWSIIFMMSMPFLILGGLSTYFYLLVRRARAGQVHPGNGRAHPGQAYPGRAHPGKAQLAVT